MILCTFCVSLIRLYVIINSWNIIFYSVLQGVFVKGTMYFTVGVFLVRVVASPQISSLRCGFHLLMLRGELKFS